MKRRVSIFYHMFPHYRAPILRSLAASDNYQYRFYGSHEPVEGIEVFIGDEEVTVHPLICKATKNGFSLRGVVQAIVSDRSAVVVLLGNPNIFQTWTAAIIARALGKKVLFWAHGWLKPEAKLKALVRNIYFGLGHGVLVYGDRARELAKASGFPDNKIYPIYNSLDWDAASPLFHDLETTSAMGSRQTLGVKPGDPVLICTARLTPLCRFDLLLDAMAILKAHGTHAKLILVGDGAERAALEAQAERLGLDVCFLGAIYDEKELSRLIHLADMTVSPGKVGLTAMHSLTYGTPVVTHSDLDQQMPEVEAIIEGQTGAFFKRGDANDLARAIRTVLTDSRTRLEIRQRCRDVMRTKYTPAAQRTLIEAAITRTLGDSR